MPFRFAWFDWIIDPVFLCGVLSTGLAFMIGALLVAFCVAGLHDVWWLWRFRFVVLSRVWVCRRCFVSFVFVTGHFVLCCLFHLCHGVV